MNPILIDFPTQFTTERVLVKMPQYEDSKQIFESKRHSLQDHKQWIGYAKEELTEESVELANRLAHIRFLKREMLVMYMFDKANGQFLGVTGFSGVNWQVRSFEIGYWLDSRQTGKGYMTEVVKGLSEFAFSALNARRVVIKCDTNNLKSCAVAQRAGFTLEGILKQDNMSADGVTLNDTVIFAKTI